MSVRPTQLNFTRGPIFRCAAKGGLLPVTTSRAAGPSRRFTPCVEAGFGEKPQDANFGGAPPLKLRAGGFLNQRRRYWQVPRLADVAGGASWRAIMLTTGAKEPSHTLPAQGDVTHARNGPGPTAPNHQPVTPARGMDDSGSRPWLRGRRSTRRLLPFASDLLPNSCRQVFTQNSLDQHSDAP